MTAIDLSFDIPFRPGESEGPATRLTAEMTELAAPAERSLLEDGGDRRVALTGDRLVWRLGSGRMAVHVTLLRGELAAGDRFAPLCRIDLRGAVLPVTELARRLDGRVPLRLSVLTISEQAEALLEVLPTHVKAGAIPLDTDMTAGQGFRVIALNCIRQFRLNENLLRHGYSEEALHQARVAIRRLRSAFSIFRPMLGPDAGAPLREELRWLASQLGEARDLDVLVGRLGDGVLRARLSPMRERAHALVLATLADSRVRSLMLDLAVWLQDGEWLRDGERAAARDTELPAMAVQSLDRYRRKVRKDGRNLTGIEDEARHELRKEAKKLRYATDFFAPLYQAKIERKPKRRFLRSLEEFQDLMGELNDRATAPVILERLGILDDPEAAGLLKAGGTSAGLKAAAGAYDRLVDAGRFWR